MKRNNDLQIQAIAAKNLAGATDAATGDYARLVNSSLQDMLDAKVFAITLLKLDWGPVTVAADGTSATVTSYETWQISSPEGSIAYEPVKNDYALVLENGTWRIKGDSQTIGAPTPIPVTPSATPTATATPSPTPTPVPTATPTPTPVPSEDVTAPMPGDEMPAPSTEEAPPQPSDQGELPPPDDQPPVE